MTWIEKEEKKLLASNLKTINKLIDKTQRDIIRSMNPKWPCGNGIFDQITAQTPASNHVSKISIP
jgi:hypothetical protein